MGLNQIVKEQIILSSGCNILTDFLVPPEINGWIFHQIIKLAFRETSQNLSSFRQVLLYFFIGRTEKPAMIPTNVWQFLFCQDFTTNIFFKLFHQCCWHVIRKVIWYVTKLRIFKILCNIFFSSSCLCPVLAVSVLYFEKKIGIGCVNIRKFVISSHIK